MTTRAEEAIGEFHFVILQEIRKRVLGLAAIIQFHFCHLLICFGHDGKGGSGDKRIGDGKIGLQPFSGSLHFGILLRLRFRCHGVVHPLGEVGHHLAQRALFYLAQCGIEV